MIWFFLAGMVAGAVGMVMYSRWWIQKHTISVRMTKEEFEKMKETQNDE